MENNIVFFDSECIQCNRFAKFIIRFRRSNQSFKLASLNNNRHTSLIEKNEGYIGNHSTMYYFCNGKLYSKSSAVFMLFSHMKFPLSIFFVFYYIVPSKLSDILYDYCAIRRKKLTCAIEDNRNDVLSPYLFE